MRDLLTHGKWEDVLLNTEEIIKLANGEDVVTTYRIVQSVTSAEIEAMGLKAGYPPKNVLSLKLEIGTYPTAPNILFCKSSLGSYFFYFTTSDRYNKKEV